ncbi:MAG: antibiotic biosynthesis monooxygenase family protein [Chloroflexota bacterium]
MSDTNVIRMGEMRAREGRAGELRDFIARVIEPALESAEGCLGHQVWRYDEDPNRFLIIEMWASISAHRASVKNINPADIQTVMELLDDSPAGQYYRTVTE